MPASQYLTASSSLMSYLFSSNASATLEAARIDRTSRKLQIVLSHDEVGSWRAMAVPPGNILEEP